MDTQELIEKRRDAAEEVAWTLTVMMMFGGLEIPQDWKNYLNGPMEEWASLAVDTGVMKPGPPQDGPLDVQPTTC